MSRESGTGHDANTVTLMYVPGEAGRIRRFTIRRSFIRGSAVFTVLLSTAIGLLATDYVRTRRELVELADLRTETGAQREQIVAYSQQMEAITQHLERVSQLDRKLRVITALDAAAPLPLPGIGGLEGSLIEPHQLNRVTRETRHRRMTEMLDQLDTAASTEAASLAALIAHLENETARLSATPSIAPVQGWITSTFGHRVSPFTGNREFHKGLDIAARMKTPIVAPADGKIIFAGHQRALGNAITIRHGYGIETIYGHLAEVSVAAGDQVRRGQKIGLVGNTGRSTGPHLHYQVQVQGSPVDPKNYVLD
jgi:murein DD-endopeptidase MepM/ murein hydrolase activator NlpD